MLLLALAILRSDLVTDWRASLPARRAELFFRQHSARSARGFSARAARAGRAARAHAADAARPAGDASTVSRCRRCTSTAAGRGRGFAEREQNLTWAAELGDDNRIVAGHWWTADRVPASRWCRWRSSTSDALGLKLGDRLRFDIAARASSVTVASFREVKWDSFRPNFFVVVPARSAGWCGGHLHDQRVSAPRPAAPWRELVHRFPGVSIFNVGDLLAQVRAVIDKAVTAVQSVFLFTLLAGLTVLLAAVQASREERRLRDRDPARARAHAAACSSSSVLVEFALLGRARGRARRERRRARWRLAGARAGLELPLRCRLYGCSASLASVLVVGAAGWLSTRSILRRAAALGAVLMRSAPR